VIRTNPDVVFRALGDGGVLVDLATNEIFEVNDTGMAIWSRLHEGAGPDAIIQSLVADFDVDEATAREDVTTWLAVLEENGLISR
jgi:hypothetical protein